MKNTAYEDIEKVIEKYKAAGYFKQAACAVFDKDKILYTCGFGGADEKSLFDLASLTKIFTTTVILKLAYEGKIQLEATIDKYLTVPVQNGSAYFKVQEAFSQISIYQLLTHTGGLMAWYPFYADGGDFYDILEKNISLPLKQGEVIYSDFDYILLGKIVEKAANRTLEEAVALYVRQPLGMKALMYCPLEKLCHQDIVVSCYDNCIEETMCAQRGLSFDGFRPHGKPVAGEANDGNCWYYFNGVSGHAGLFSNAEGVAALGRFYLDAWAKAPSSLFADALRAHEGTRGLGFETGFLYPQGCGHTGFTGTSLYLSAENNIGAVLLTNRLTGKVDEKAPDMTQCRREVHEAVLFNAIKSKKGSPSFKGLTRTAKLCDADAIARIYHQGLLAAYRSLLPKTYFDSFSMEDAVLLWQKNLAREDYHCILWEEDGKTAGFIGMKADDEYENCLMLAALYVDEAYKGRAIGTKLIYEAHRLAKALGKQRVSIVVVLKNERAKRLYEHLGAVFAKESVYDFGGNRLKCGKYLWVF